MIKINILSNIIDIISLMKQTRLNNVGILLVHIDQEKITNQFINSMQVWGNTIEI